MTQSRLVLLGVITSAHGIRGQVKIRCFTEIPEDITAYGALSDKKGRVYDVTVTSLHNDSVIASIGGIVTRNDAEALKSIELFVPRSALPEPEAHEFYHEDLIGLNIVTAKGEAFGKVKAVHNFGAGDLLLVTLTSGEEEYFPFNRTVFPDISPGTGKITIDPPVIETSGNEDD